MKRVFCLPKVVSDRHIDVMRPYLLQVFSYFFLISTQNTGGFGELGGFTAIQRFFDDAGDALAVDHCRHADENILFAIFAFQQRGNG